LSLTGQGKLQNRKIISIFFLTETEVTVVEGSDTENEQEEQTEPVNVVEQTDEEDSESERESEMSSHKMLQIHKWAKLLQLYYLKCTKYLCKQRFVFSKLLNLYEL
jgi:hypothetical protein